ncbi:SpoIID/LytB domain-containing protein [Bacillus sp. V59.32b]|uniref:SpoIID/LytB domain-containing protein n=1 Tax=Bacillus sp. V59.32b TaxID=1758642 RepID=UPI000E3DAD73|nr:SpoIID/LytB domain-containing protein [Bacillus sp. V59.32b]RFU60126.1 SpoIID/LytB domain-containing protein [Bacillus sp. V59.32b]
MKTLKRYMLMGLALVLILSILPGFQLKANAEESVINVKLKNPKFIGDKSELTIKPAVTYTTNLPNVKFLAGQTYLLRVSGSNIKVLQNSTDIGQVSALEIKPEKGNGPLSINNRNYLGSFKFSNEDGKYVRPINSIGLEDYLKGVVPFEMISSWNVEALKAQAVAARTYAMSYLNGTPDDTQTYQVYGGYEWYANTTRAVEETAGQIITYNGNSIGRNAVYSSSNGGQTESGSNAWGSEVGYLQSKDDPYDPKTTWSYSVKKKQIDASKLDLNKAGEWWATTAEVENTKIITNIKNWIRKRDSIADNVEIKITDIPVLSLYETNSSGRMNKGSITVDYLTLEKGKQTAVKRQTIRPGTASDIRTIIGGDIMKSILVDEVKTSEESVEVRGRGFGHGVGMSQYGAKKAAESGLTYNKILAFYFSNTSIKDSILPKITAVKTSFDSKINQAKLDFTTSENAKITVQVKDQNSKVIATLVNGVQKTAGSQSTVWNAASVNNGKYTFVITVADSNNNTSTASTPFTLAKPIPKDTTAPVISNTATSMKSNVVSLKYQLNEAAKVTILVKDAKGKTVATVATNLQKQKGISWASWNASKAVNGKYTFNITAVDGSNNKRIANVAYTLNKPKPAPKVMTGTVNVTKLNVRATASTSGKLLGSLKKNQRVTVLSKSGSWYKIQFGKSTGYVHVNYLSNVK